MDVSPVKKTHQMALQELLYKIKCPWKNDEKIIGASKIARTSASLESIMPTCFTNMNKTFPRVVSISNALRIWIIPSCAINIKFHKSLPLSQPDPNLLSSSQLKIRCLLDV